MRDDDEGFIFVRMDVHYGSHLRLLADEVFGEDLFQNELVVNRIKKNVTEKGRRTIPHAVDSLFVYSRALYPNLHGKRVIQQSTYYRNDS